MSDLQFKPISLDRMDEYLERFHQCPAPTSDYSFTNIWGWAYEYGLEWAWSPTQVWIRQTVPEVRYWAPVGPWQDVDWTKCPYLSPDGVPREFNRVPEMLKNIWEEQVSNRLTISNAEGQWDYVYNAQDLAELRGNRFHKKKNHVNQFKKHYNWEYHPMTSDCVEYVMEMQEEWCQWRECEESEALIAENEVIIRVLEEWDVIPDLVGGVLYVDGEMVAYSIGEALTENMMVVHFEKGKNGFRGVYQAINKMFIEHEGQRFELVNREQDLDDPGLRKAKLSYHPVDYMKKYTVTVQS